MILLNDEFITDLKAEKCRRRFYDFVKEFWSSADPSTPVWNWHIEYLCDTLEEDVRLLLNKQAKKNDIIINCPPGVSKSMIVSVMLPAWVWTIDQSIKIISASASSSVSTELALKSRNLIMSDKYNKFFKFTLKDDENNKTNFKTNKGGFRYVTSANSNILSIHADLIIIDDIQNLASVESEAERLSLDRWLTGSLFMRKTDKLRTLTIFVQQRLHELDQTSQLIDKIGSQYFKHIVLPASISDKIRPIPEHLSQFYVNNLLDVNRLNDKVIADAIKYMGTRNYNAQFQQFPSSQEDSIIKKSWFHIEKDDKILEKLKKLPIKYYLDTAYGEKNSDYTAILECVKFENVLYIIKCEQVNLNFPDLIRYLNEITKGKKIEYMCVEGKASGKSIIQQLRTMTKLNVIEINPKSSKLSRLNSISATVESLKVKLIDGYWIDEFLNQICTNNSAHDDMQDTLCYSVEREFTVNNSSTIKFY